MEFFPALLSPKESISMIDHIQAHFEVHGFGVGRHCRIDDAPQKGSGPVVLSNIWRSTRGGRAIAEATRFWGIWWITSDKSPDRRQSLMGRLLRVRSQGGVFTTAYRRGPEVAFWSVTLLARLFCGHMSSKPVSGQVTSECCSEHYVHFN
jgi:hypothetical protein